MLILPSHCSGLPVPSANSAAVSGPLEEFLAGVLLALDHQFHVFAGKSSDIVSDIEQLLGRANRSSTFVSLMLLTTTGTGPSHGDETASR